MRDLLKQKGASETYSLEDSETTPSHSQRQLVSLITEEAQEQADREDIREETRARNFWHLLENAQHILLRKSVTV